MVHRATEAVDQCSTSACKKDASRKTVDRLAAQAQKIIALVKARNPSVASSYEVQKFEEILGETKNGDVPAEAANELGTITGRFVTMGY